IAFAAIKRDVDLQRPSVKRPRPKLVEDGLRIVGAIKIADTGMIAPDNEMRTAEVLANEGMKERLARTRIAHFDRIAGLNDRSGSKIIVDHRLDCPGADLGRYVARFQFSEHLMNENPVRYLHRDFDQVFVAAVHGISGLKRGDNRPAALQKQRAC